MVANLVHETYGNEKSIFNFVKINRKKKGFKT